MKKNTSAGPLSLLTVGILFGLSGSLAKYLGTWLNAYQTVAVRFFVACLLGILFLILTKKKFDISKVNKMKLGLFAISFPAQAIFFTLSVFYTKIALAVFAFYIANLLSSFLLGNIFFKEKIDSKKSLALVLIVGSLLCLTNPFQNFHLSIGFLFGLTAGVLQTFASIFQRTIGKGTDRLTLVIIQTFTGVVMAVLAMILTNTLIIPSISLLGILVSVFFGAVFLVIAYLSLIGFQKTNLNVGSMLVSTELFFGPLFAFVIFHESLGTLELLGGFLTIAAVILVNSNLRKDIAKA